ncbi:hypothetical protein ACFZAV_07315 [Streptomyces sp. NPDC008343]|uniref:hypothetical protein n=1 Tax=Streptomyces sp. NPDC008343 TaxID=3364828 RepID=UPI0036E2A7C6
MAVIVVAVLVFSLGDDDESTTSVPTDAATEKASQGEKQEPQGERADLLRFQLDDRSTVGITNIWAVWTIKNSSNKKSDYSWEWEAVDASGTRLANGTQWETSVQPGQTARGEYPTTLKTAKGVELNVTSFNRTAS